MRTPPTARQGSEGERALETHLRQLGVAFEREFQFAPGRRFRADFMVCGISPLLVEVDGGAFSESRHRTGVGFTRDCEKASLAAVHGFRVIRCTTEQVESGECAAWIERAIGR